MIGFNRALPTAALVLLAAVAIRPAGAQGDAGYPSKPIHLIVGFAAGGGNDLFARLVGQKLSENIGQPVIVENKAGAGGRIAVEYVKNQPADGYTIMVAASGQMAIAAAIYPKLSYHPTRDFVPLTMIASFPLILAGPANDSIKSVKDLVAYGKANPDKSNYATSSPAFTITTELFKLKTGMPAVAVPYKSSNEMMLSVAGGNTLFSIADGPPTMPLVQAARCARSPSPGRSARPSFPTCRAWRRQAIRRSISGCGAACSSRPARRRPSPRSSRRSCDARSPMPACARSSRPWRSIPAAARARSSARRSTVTSNCSPTSSRPRT
jgi:tripartite-type tricarboxylate transporter receptor subunit TctC